MPRGSGLTRVTLVEDHALFAEVMEIALTIEGHEVQRMAFGTHTATPERLVTSILSSRPSVVLLDPNLGSPTDGQGLIRRLTEAGIAVIVLTGSGDRARWGECLLNGACIVMSKSTPLSAIVSAIAQICDGRTILADEERDRLIACFHADQSQTQVGDARLRTLTRREREILIELMRGRQVAQIAHDNVVSEATVRTQVRSILAKLKVSSQLAAVGMALRSRWEQPMHPELRD